MAYKNGKYICDSCGAVKERSTASGWDNANDGAKCPACKERTELLKIQKEQLKMQKQQIKRQQSEEKLSNFTSGGYKNYSYDDGDGIDWKDFTGICVMVGLFMLKWASSLAWGGPFLIYEGYRYSKKTCAIIGALMTLVFIVGAIILGYFDTLEEGLQIVEVGSNVVAGFFLGNIAVTVGYFIHYKPRYEEM